MERIFLKTRGFTDFVRITSQVQDVVKKVRCQEGVVFLFVKGSTVALTIMEWEEGLKKDIKNVLEKIAPQDFNWEHHKKWDDYNGSAHIRSALIKPDLIVPIEGGKLVLGTWQDIVLIDFDLEEREREILVKVICD